MSLQEATAADSVNELYSLIEEDENLLDHGSQGPFPNTPLHVAAEQGKTKVAMEIATLKPPFARKLNRGGYSPMHLALQKKHYRTVRALMTLDPELVRVRGRGGITPLHFVAGEKGDNGWDSVELLELLAEFLSACKSSIEDLTNQCETAVHVAVRTGNSEAFKVLFGWLKRVHLTRILDWKDQNGDTVLHIAASEKQPKIIKLLIGYTAVKAKNFQGKTALDIFQENPSGDQDLAKRSRRLGRRAITPTLSLSQFFSKELTYFEKCANCFRIPDESARNIILVVSTLIAAATYQAALTPPGGYWQDSSSNATTNSTVVITNSSSIDSGKKHQAGDIILKGWGFTVYTIHNSMAFFASITTIWATTFTVEANPLLHIPIPLLCVAYYWSLGIQIPQDCEAADFYLLGLFGFCLIAVFGAPVLWKIKYERARRRIDATRGCVATFDDRRIQCACIAVGRPHQAGNMILKGWELFGFTVLNNTAF
ncbi:ankyrin repeat-containing protein BDA1-like [Rhodamnia argentea]|uniref:Ankyrin repeat-containing protein BDA1-like n=1 Tax=Rhodamnia argentea TaxID=178133 RepID=A0ABM3HW31_9MYRT|nr:ankyrin repeat-containing protein BDA1-like [Rhodamnia argentea]